MPFLVSELVQEMILSSISLHQSISFEGGYEYYSIKESCFGVPQFQETVTCPGNGKRSCTVRATDTCDCRSVDQSHGISLDDVGRIWHTLSMECFHFYIKLLAVRMPTVGSRA